MRLTIALDAVQSEKGLEFRLRQYAPTHIDIVAMDESRKVEWLVASFRPNPDGLVELVKIGGIPDSHFMLDGCGRIHVTFG
jgi:hypothetical protein